MHEFQPIGDRKRIQYSPAPKPDETSGRPWVQMVLETKPDAVALELKSEIGSLDSSFDPNMRKQQFDLGGEA